LQFFLDQKIFPHITPLNDLSSQVCTKRKIETDVALTPESN